MRSDRVLRGVIRERFLVTLQSGEAFEGVLADADAKSVVLNDPFLVREKDRTSVDSDLFIPRAEIRYMQRVVR